MCVCVCITVCESDLGLQVPGRFIGDPVALSIRLSVCKSAGLVLLYTGFLSHESDCLICVLWLVFTEIRRLADALSCSINATGEYGLDLLVLTARCIQVRDLKTLSSVKVLKLCVFCPAVFELQTSVIPQIMCVTSAGRLLNHY